MYAVAVLCVCLLLMRSFDSLWSQREGKSNSNTQSMVSLNRRNITQSLLLWSHQHFKAAATEVQWSATEKLLIQISL